MNAIHPKIFVDEKGTPQEVLVSWDEYKDIIETLGLDLDEKSQKDLGVGNWEDFFERGG